jgi:hypothetical protein
LLMSRKSSLKCALNHEATTSNLTIEVLEKM